MSDHDADLATDGTSRETTAAGVINAPAAPSPDQAQRQAYTRRLKRRAILGAILGAIAGYPLSYLFQYGDRHDITSFSEYLTQIGRVLTTEGLRATAQTIWITCIFLFPAILTFMALEAGSVSRFRVWLRGTDSKYEVGTLTYTRAGLFLMFFWLLWGDLIWGLMESVYPASMPLQLDRLNVPKDWTGYLMGTLGASVNVLLVPIISVRSDRARTRWGRRIPYIIFSMVPLCVFLAILGYTDTFGPWITESNWSAKLHLSPMATLIIVLAVLMVLYDVANVFVNCVFWYLFRDVIPDAFLGRFMSAFRIVGILSGMLWNGLIIGHLEAHTGGVWHIRYLYVGAAIAYLLGFGLMCLMVKEGEYPPPEVTPTGDPWLKKSWRNIATYARECFTHPLFIVFYISNTVFAISYQTGMYRQFYFLRHLHFSLADMGKVGLVMAPIVFAVQFPMGWLVDKIHPMRASLIGSLCATPFIFAGYFVQDYTLGSYVIHAFTIYVLISVLGMPFSQLNGAADQPMVMRLFPKKQYGQFASANALLRHFTTIFGSLMGATFMGIMGAKFGYEGNRISWLWQGCLHIVAVTCLAIVFFYWKKMGAERFEFDPEKPNAPILDANGVSLPPLSRAALWRPILIGAIPAVLALALGFTGIVALLNRPDIHYEVDKDKKLAAITSAEDLRTWLATQTQLLSEQHERNLGTLAKGHWFADSDRPAELANYEYALQEANTLAGGTLLRINWTQITPYLHQNWQDLNALLPHRFVQPDR